MESEEEVCNGAISTSPSFDRMSRIRTLDVRLVLLGSGLPKYETFLRDAKSIRLNTDTRQRIEK